MMPAQSLHALRLECGPQLQSLLRTHQPRTARLEGLRDMALHVSQQVGPTGAREGRGCATWHCMCHSRWGGGRGECIPGSSSVHCRRHCTTWYYGVHAAASPLYRMLTQVLASLWALASRRRESEYSIAYETRARSCPAAAHPQLPLSTPSVISCGPEPCSLKA